MNKKLLSKIALILFTMTICTSVKTNTYAKNECKRIYGQNRIETSIKISEKGWENGSNVAVIAQGYNYADALCSSSLAKKYNAPILLTGSAKLDENVVKELKRLKVNKVFIAGGKAVISEKVEEQLKSLNIKNVKRLYGKNRYETSLEIAKELGSSKEIFITSGNGYADSLSVAPIAARKGAPILFSEKNSLKDSVKKYINSVNPDKTYVVGGKGVIADSVEKDMKNVERISGKNRFETNKNVLSRFKEELNFDNIYIVQGAGPKGNEFADALSCSALAAQKGSPIVLTYNGIDESLKKFVKENLKDSSKIIAIGGETVVSSSVIDKIKKSDNKPNVPSGGGGSSGGGSSTNHSKPSKPNNDKEPFVVKSNKNKISMIISNEVAKEVTITIYDSNNSLAYIGQLKLDNGKVSFNTKLDDGKYYGYYKFVGQSDNTKVEFEIKNGNVEGKEKPIDKKDNSCKVNVEGKDISIKIIDSKNKNAEVTITLYDKNGDLAYIGQQALKNGEYTFKTQLESGEYNGFYRVFNGDKVSIEKFEVK